MNNTVWGFHVLLLWLAVTGLSYAGENLRCPDKVRLASGSVVSEDVPPGYKPLVSNSIVRLTGVTVYDGPPEDGAVLMPSSFSKSGEKIKWILVGTNEKGTWVSCDYSNGLIRLVKQIGEPTTTCTATIKKTEPHKTLDARFTCK